MIIDLSSESNSFFYIIWFLQLANKRPETLSERLKNITNGLYWTKVENINDSTHNHFHLQKFKDVKKNVKDGNLKFVIKINKNYQVKEILMNVIQFHPCDFTSTVF